MPTVGLELCPLSFVVDRFSYFADREAIEHNAPCEQLGALRSPWSLYAVFQRARQPHC